MSFGALVFTPLVKKLQDRYGSRKQYERMEKSGQAQDSFSAFEKKFIADRDTFYIASTGETGWPYIQHRGGPKGFLKVIDDRTLAFADFSGNKQYISTGNLQGDDRVAMILIDYPRQARLKVLGHVQIFEGPEANNWIARLREPGYKAVIERVYVITLAAYDWNCQQHIVPRYTVEEIRTGMQEFEQRMQDLEREKESLRKELERIKSTTHSNVARP